MQLYMQLLWYLPGVINQRFKKEEYTYFNFSKEPLRSSMLSEKCETQLKILKKIRCSGPVAHQVLPDGQN